MGASQPRATRLKESSTADTLRTAARLSEGHGLGGDLFPLLDLPFSGS